jgi:cysteinyl-tRNA synthetase
VTPHYRSTIEFSEAGLKEAASAFGRIENFVRKVVDRTGSVEPGEVSEDFAQALDDDLGTPQATAAVHAAVREGNAALDRGDDEAARAAASAVRAMTGVLGLDPLSPQWAEDGGNAAYDALGEAVRLVLEQRQKARAERDFATADLLRDRLQEGGIAVEDTPDGPTWTLKDG